VDSDDSAEAIRRRMAELRRELTCDVRDVKRSAKEMANPLHHLRQHPWATAALAAAVGYLLVPKKSKAITPDPELLAELVRKHQVKLDTSKVTEDKQSMLKSLAVMGLTWALRTGLTYAGQQLAAAATAKATGGEEPPAASDHPPAPSPLEEPWNTTG
jgi:hypothetical protein